MSRIFDNLLVQGTHLSVGTPTPDPSSILDLTSTTSGFLMPRMTSIQRAAIFAPATGLQVYDTTVNDVYVFNGSSWAGTGSIGGTLSGGYVPVATDASTLGNSVMFQNGGNVGIGTTTPTSTLHIQGTGLTSATYSLKVDNSSSVTNFSISDDGVVHFAGTVQFVSPTETVLWIDTNSGNDNVWVGTNNVIPSSSGVFNVMIGKDTGIATFTGNSNVAIGHGAMHGASGSNNIGIGENALISGPSADYNIGIGDQTLAALTTGTQNIAMGHASGFGLTTGSGNVYIGGSNAFFNTATGSDNVGIGFNALSSVTTAADNVAMGTDALKSATTVNYNVAVGAGANINNSTFDNCIVIGNFMDTDAANQMMLGSGISWLSGGAFVNPISDLYLNGFDSGASYAMTIHATGGHGSNQVGADLTLAGGQGTGSGIGGNIIFSVAPELPASPDTTLNTLVEAMRITHAGNVGIGTTTPDASARVDITSTTQGFLPPRMTTTEVNAITSPAAGLLVWNTTTNRYNYWDGSQWNYITGTPGN